MLSVVLSVVVGCVVGCCRLLCVIVIVIVIAKSRFLVCAGVWKASVVALQSHVISRRRCSLVLRFVIIVFSRSRFFLKERNCWRHRIRQPSPHSDHGLGQHQENADDGVSSDSGHMRTRTHGITSDRELLLHSACGGNVQVTFLFSAVCVCWGQQVMPGAACVLFQRGLFSFLLCRVLRCAAVHVMMQVRFPTPGSINSSSRQIPLTVFLVSCATRRDRKNVCGQTHRATTAHRNSYTNRGDMLPTV